MVKQSYYGLVLLFCSLLISACTNEIEIQPVSKAVQQQEENGYVIGLDPNFKPEEGTAGGRIASDVKVKVNKIRVWIYRGSEATGTFQFKIRKLSSGKLIAQSGSTSVSHISLLPDHPSTATGKLIFGLNGLELKANETYRMEIVFSDAVRSSDPTSKKIFWGATPQSNPELLTGNMGQSIITSSSTTETPFNDVTDAVFETEYLDDDGNTYIDQSQMSFGVFKSLNDLTSIPSNLTQIVGWQKFVPHCKKISFEDTNLEQAIRTQLGFSADQPITECDVLGITELYAIGAHISKLGGIEYLSNLTSLNLRSNSIVNLVPLQRLSNLESLLLYDNDILSLSPLANLNKLQVLDVAFNSISDIRPLQDLRAIEVLDFTSNKVSSIGVLANLSNLKQLGISENPVNSLTAIQNLTNLTILNMWKTYITDISPLVSFTSLTELRMGENAINNLSSISALPQLKKLSLNQCSLNNNSLSSVVPLANLIELNLSGNSGITSGQLLYNMDQLVDLYMIGTSLSNAQKTALQNNLPHTTIYY